MTADQNVQIVRIVMGELMRGNAEPLLSVLTEDTVIKAIIPAGTPISGDFRGRAGCLRYLTAMNEAMEILDYQVYDHAASADHVAILGFERARIRRTGKMLESEFATVITLAEGKITKILALTDMTAIVDAYR